MSSNERRVGKSHKDFDKLFGLANRIAQAKNPQRFFDGSKDQEEGLTSQVEWQAGLQQLEDTMTEELQGGIFRDAVEDLPIRKRVSPKR